MKEPNIEEIAGRLLRYWRDTGKGIPIPRLAVAFAEAYLRPDPNVDATWLYQLPPAQPQNLEDVREIIWRRPKLCAGAQFDETAAEAAE